MSPKRVAVVGSGCGAMGALWALRDSQCTIHLYESDGRLGGHTNTVVFRKNDFSVPVDAGFIAMNQETYPNFVRFLDHLEIERARSEMSLAFSRNNGDFEWAGTSLLGLFAQPTNVFRPSFWRMLFDIVRFNFFALDLLRRDVAPTSGDQKVDENFAFLMHGRSNERFESIGSYLKRKRYSESFINNYLIPMLAATWCTRFDIFQLQCPAQDVVQFMWNHHLLESLSNPLEWYTIKGGAKTYIDRFLALHPPAATFLDSPVTHLKRLPDGTIELHTPKRQERVYDHVILTTSAQTSLSILHNSASPEERRLLSQFTTCTNTVYLHSDLSFMPLRRSAWSGWNCLATTTSSSSSSTTTNSPLGGAPTPTVTFDMNTLQHVPRATFGPVLFTMNPATRLPDPSKIQGSWTYRHPVFSASAIRAQPELLRLGGGGGGGVSFAGAWTGQGFHEDGFTSGIRAAVGFLEGAGLHPGPERGYVRRYRRDPPCAPGVWEGLVRLVLAGILGVWIVISELRWGAEL